MVLKEKFKGENVLFLDETRHNLLIVSQMCDQVHEVIFKSKICVVIIFYACKTIIKGIITQGNVYILKHGKEH